jgi:hypothetical protein
LQILKINVSAENRLLQAWLKLMADFLIVGVERLNGKIYSYTPSSSARDETPQNHNNWTCSGVRIVLSR